MKYIVLQTVVSNAVGVTREYPIIFPSSLVHSEVAEHMQHLLLREHGVTSIAVAAGDLNLAGFNLNCSGKSITLNLDSREGVDSALISTHDYYHGVVENQEKDNES